MKSRGNYVATSTATLTQSGLLGVLLQHQRRKVIELARRRAHRKQLRAAFWGSISWLSARVQLSSPFSDVHYQGSTHRG